MRMGNLSWRRVVTRNKQLSEFAAHICRNTHIGATLYEYETDAEVLRNL